MSAFADLSLRLREIQDLIHQATAARGRPARREYDIRRMRDFFRKYRDETAVDLELGRGAIDRLAAEERRQAEIAAVRERKRLAVILDRLRADLPALAEAARFELVDVALDWRTFDFQKGPDQ